MRADLMPRPLADTASHQCQGFLSLRHGRAVFANTPRPGGGIPLQRGSGGTGKPGENAHLGMTHRLSFVPQGADTRAAGHIQGCAHFKIPRRVADHQREIPLVHNAVRFGLPPQAFASRGDGGEHQPGGSRVQSVEEFRK